MLSVVVLASLGCAVDDRTLLADNGTSGSGSGGSAGKAGSAGSTGSNFAGVPGSVDLPVCSYSDEVEPGCETMIANAGFGADTDGWKEEPLDIVIGWDEEDATGSEASGSIAVVNAVLGRADGISASGAAQCLPATPGTIYDMAADVFVPTGQGQGYEEKTYLGRAGLSILFWPNENCARTEQSLVPSFQTNLVELPDAWSRVEGSAKAPDLAKSMSVRVLTVKDFRQYTFKALFDNILVQER